MSIPTAPTDTSIVTDAWKKFGISSPTSTQISLGISNGLEFVKRDIMDRGTTWKFLMTSTTLPTTIGVDRYIVPTDFERFIQARLLDGTSRGTAASGSTGSITLASTEVTTTNIYRGNYIAITGGAGSGQIAQISDYSVGRVATFDRALATACSNTSQYLLVTDWWPLSPKPYTNITEVRRPQISRMPTVVYYTLNDNEGDLYLDFTPDKVYSIWLDYYMDLRKVDLSSTRYSTLLRRLAGVLTQGVFVWALQNDSRYVEERAIYEKMLSRLSGKQLWGVDDVNAQCQVND